MVTMKVIIAFLVLFASGFCHAKHIPRGLANRPELQRQESAPDPGPTSNDEQHSNTIPSSAEHGSRAQKLPLPWISPLDAKSQQTFRRVKEYSFDKQQISSRRIKRAYDHAHICENLPEDVPAEEIIKECKNDNEVGSYWVKDKNLNLSKLEFSQFISCPERKEIWTILLIEMTDLETIRNEGQPDFIQGFNIINNNNLKSIDINVRKSWHLTFSNNNLLANVNFPTLSESLEEIRLKNNGKEAEYLRINFTSVNKVRDFIVSDNPTLKEIKMPNVNNTDANDIVITGNRMLLLIELPKLPKVRRLQLFENAVLEKVNFNEIKTFYDRHTSSILRIQNNQALKDIVLPKLTLFPQEFIISDNAALESVVLGNKNVNVELSPYWTRGTIAGNPSLREIVFGNITKPTLLKKLHIYGNKNLTRKNIHVPDCPPGLDWYIQGDNECIFKEYITDLSVLNGCKAIYDHLSISDNATGETSAKLAIITGDLRIRNSFFDAKKLEFLENTHVKGYLRLELSRNVYLETIKIENVGKMGDYFSLESNKALREVLLSKIGSFPDSKVTVSDNVNLTTLVLGVDSTIQYTLTISNNPSLSQISFAKIANPENMTNIAIYGNKNLARVNIHFPDCPELTNCYIQDDYECAVNGSITDLSELDGCQSIYKNLVLSNSLTGNTTTKIVTIQGDLRIVNASFELTELSFLENTTVKGDIVITSSCVMMAEISHLNITYRNISFINSTCSRNCTPDDLWVYKQPDCETIVGDLDIGYDFFSDVDVHNFKSIKRVIGSVIIDNINPYPWDTPPLIFENLEEIIGASLEIWSITYTTEFIMPKLRLVQSEYKHFLSLKANSFFKDPDECVRLEAKLGHRAVDPIDLEPGNLVTEYVTIDEDSLNFDNEDKGAHLVHSTVCSAMIFVFVAVFM